MPIVNDLDKEIPKPEYETIELRDLVVSYPSGIKDVCLQPEDRLTVDHVTGDIFVIEHADGREHVFRGKNMECYTLAVRAFRRVKKELK